MVWSLAPSLMALRGEVDAVYPDRGRASDGTLGDARHAGTTSDHNPDSRGMVRAWDCTAWEASNGVNVAGRLAEFLRHSRDSRIKYVIYNRRIFSSTIQPWVWRPYGGSSPHTSHAHISVKPYPNGDSNKPWGFQNPEDTEMTPAEIDAIVSAVWSAPCGGDREPSNAPTKFANVIQRLNHNVNLSGVVGDVDAIRAEVQAIRVDVAALRESVDSLVAALAAGSPGASAEMIAAASADEISRRMGRRD